MLTIPQRWLDSLAACRLGPTAAATRFILSAPEAARRVIRNGSVCSIRDAAVLYVLSRSGSMDIGRIERSLGINAAAIFYVADGMARKGLVTTERAERSSGLGPEVLVTLTPAGWDVIGRCG